MTLAKRLKYGQIGIVNMIFGFWIVGCLIAMFFWNYYTTPIIIATVFLAAFAFCFVSCIPSKILVLDKKTGKIKADFPKPIKLLFPPRGFYVSYDKLSETTLIFFNEDDEGDDEDEDDEGDDEDVESERENKNPPIESCLTVEYNYGGSQETAISLFLEYGENIREGLNAVIKKALEPIFTEQSDNLALTETVEMAKVLIEALKIESLAVVSISLEETIQEQKELYKKSWSN
ncbi:MAG: hypothetical protein WCW02_04695 [Candidatus Buchananbacteria bacterium]